MKRSRVQVGVVNTASPSVTTKTTYISSTLPLGYVHRMSHPEIDPRFCSSLAVLVRRLDEEFQVLWAYHENIGIKRTCSRVIHL